MTDPVEVRTHTAIERSLSGTPVATSDGRAVLRLETSASMTADDRGLVHGGFIFSLADHAAMVAVNEPLVVLGSAQVKFLRPVRVGRELEAIAEVDEVSGRKHIVSVTASVVGEGEVVFEGSFVCFVPDRHVLD